MTTDPTTLPVLLEVRDLVVGYHNDDNELVTLVDGVSFTVREREVLCLVGESGSGKSVTMLAVLGLLPPPLHIVSGSVHYRGRDVLGLSERELRRLRGSELGMVFQDPMTAMNPVKRVGSQIVRAIAVHNPTLSRTEAAGRAVELLQNVGVTNAAERARSYPHQWSGGMRQRAMIAMAMANNPSVLVADEPTTALDVTIQAQIMSLLAGLRERNGAAMVLITHDLGLVAEAADNICVMYAGRIVERGNVWDTFAHPTHPYTAGLLGSLLTADHAGDRIYAIPGSPPSPTNRQSGCPFAPRCELPAKSALCEQVNPALTHVADSQSAACHYAEQTARFAEAVA